MKLVLWLTPALLIRSVTSVAAAAALATSSSLVTSIMIGTRLGGCGERGNIPRGGVDLGCAAGLQRRYERLRDRAGGPGDENDGTLDALGHAADPWL